MSRLVHKDKRDANEDSIVEALEQAGASVRRMSETGFTDLVVGVPEGNILMEVKGPSGRLTPAQREFFKTWRGPKFIVRSPEEAIAILNNVRTG